MIRASLGLLAAAGMQPAAGGSPNRAEPATRAAVAKALPSLFSSEDYPIAALRNEETGTVSFAVTVDRQGRARTCTITASSGSASLDSTTCAIIQRRARFSPARDAAGRPVEDSAHGKIRWELPFHEVKDDVARIFVAIKDGAPAACRTEAKAAAPDGCERVRDYVRLLLAEGDASTAREALLEYGERIGDLSGLAMPVAGAGRKMLGVDAVTMTIAADGTVADCRPTPGVTDNMADGSNCAKLVTRRFEPQPAGVTALRHLTNYQFLELRGMAPSPQITNLQTLFSPDDYPADALARAIEGRVGAEVTVEADGRASACVIKASSGTPSLDAVTCARLMSKGRYEAARDPEQHAVRGTLFRRIAWELPVAPIDDRFSRAVIALPTGKSCKIEGNPDDALDSDEARRSAELAMASPDSRGKRALVVEYGQVIGTGESIERISEGRGQSHWYMSAVTLMVDAAGKLVECKPSFDWVGAGDAKEQCGVAGKDRFEPLEAGVANRQPRALTRYEAIYFRD